MSAAQFENFFVATDVIWLADAGEVDIAAVRIRAIVKTNFFISFSPT